MHKVRNRVEAAYPRSDPFERRRRIMNNWAAYRHTSASSDRGTGGTRSRRKRRDHYRTRTCLPPRRSHRSCRRVRARTRLGRTSGTGHGSSAAGHRTISAGVPVDPGEADGEDSGERGRLPGEDQGHERAARQPRMEPLGVRSQPTLWGHASRVPKGAGGGLCPL